jgi:glycosyltransferase involved in cell wall biosynthesis
MTDRFTIIILTPGFPADESDSVCLPLLQAFLLSLRSQYPAVTIRVLSFQYPYHTKVYTWNGITIFPFNGKNRGGFTRLLLRRRINITLKELQKKEGQLLLLSMWYGECAWVGNYFAKKNHVAHYCWLQGQDARKTNRYPKQTGLSGGTIIALSDFLQEEFKRNHAVKPSLVIPAGVTIKENNHTGNHNIDILAVGSLIPLKQFELLIRLVASLKNELPGIRCILIGDGPEKGRLLKLISESSLENNIVLTGELPHAAVREMMTRSRLLVHPSSYEGFSGVCLEALQAGAHVISFTRAMNRDIPQWHIVKDEEEMKEKAVSLLKNPSLSHHAINEFDINTTTKQMMRLFTDTIAGSSK